MTASRNAANPSPDDHSSKPHTVRKRTRARELVLRALYLIDVRGPEALAEVPAFFAAKTNDPDVLAFARQVFDGIVEHRDELDAKIANVAENWQIHRMAVIDRNLLRLGTFEFTHLADVPPKVSINEAIDLAKRYSTADSGAFVNGILDKLRTEIRPE
jgi:transcription antitermination factor NusB